MNRLKQWVLKILLGKEVYDNMAIIYATLIVKGKKKLSDVPAVIRPDVEQILADLEVTIEEALCEMDSAINRGGEK